MKAVIRVRLAAAAGIAAAVCASTPAFAAAAPATAPSGSVLYAFHTPFVYPDPQGPGSAQLRTSLTASYTGCDPAETTPCRWQAVAQALAGGCLPDPRMNPYPYTSWFSPILSANGTFDSGEKTFRIGTTNGFQVNKVCLYVVSPQDPTDEYAWSVLVDVQTIEPEPPPPLVLTRPLARKTARQLLRSQRPSWHGASNKHLRCQQSGPNAYSCTARWRSKRTAYAEQITVAVENNSAVARFG
jgi:hypothetical protein